MLMKALLLAGCSSMCVLATAQQLYTITPLFPVPGDSQSFANGISNQGMVVGASSLNASPRAGYWSGSSDFIQMPGGQESWGVNDLGQATGFTFDRAFLFDSAGGTFTTFEPTGSYTKTYGARVNNSGVVVGYVRDDLGHGEAAIFGSNGSTTFLGRFGGNVSTGADINSSGVATGWSDASAGTRAFRYVGGSMVVLNPVAGYTQSVGKAINLSGTIAGSSYDTFGAGAATIWTGTQATRMASVAGGTTAVANGINDSGLVVGSTVVSGTLRAAMFGETNSVLLESLLVNGQGWTLAEAKDVNNSGWIVGNGRFNGNSVGFIMKPVPEPASISVLSLGTLIALRRRRSKK